MPVIKLRRHFSGPCEFLGGVYEGRAVQGPRSSPNGAHKGHSGRLEERRDIRIFGQGGELLPYGGKPPGHVDAVVSVSDGPVEVGQKIAAFDNPRRDDI
jgi:hypothetical protein